MLLLQRMQTIKQTIEDVLDSLGYSPDSFDISYPPNAAMGDYAINLALKQAKKQKKPPMELAKKIQKQVKAENSISGIFSDIIVVNPGFINFHIKPEYAQEQLKAVLKTGTAYGSSNIGKGKTVIVEYSSPNIAKQMHVGHLRSTIIGQALYNMYSFAGYQVIADNHLGDWGTGFGKLIAAYREKYGDEIKDDISIAEMEELYVDFSTKAKADEGLLEQARQEVVSLQDGEPFHIALWGLFRQKSLDELEETIYQPLQAHFDTVYGEAFFYKLPAVKEIYKEESNEYVDTIVEDLLKSGIAQESEGAIIIPSGHEDQPPMLIRKSDGTHLYATSDLATVKMRQKKYKPDRVLYVVAHQQDLHFRQVIEVAEKLAYVEQGKLYHIPFGMVLGEGGKKMSTREGNVVSARDILERSIAEARKIVDEKNPGLADDEKQEVARVVGLGALKYNDLSRDRMTNITFDWEKMMSLSSDSSPYLQYTYARIQSIITKAGGEIDTFDAAQLVTDPEVAVLKHVIKFQEKVEEAVLQDKPNVISLYLQGLASSFHSLYESTPVLQDDKELQAARLGLMQAVAQVMQNGLRLLGIEVLKKI